MTRRSAITSVVVGVLSLGFAFGPEILHSATCTGATPCKACKNCRYCAHCKKRGGTCGVCRKPAP